MALLFGNDYYWTKSILALNLIYFTRMLNYLKNAPFCTSDEFWKEKGYKSLMVYIIRIIYYDENESVFKKLFLYLKFGKTSEFEDSSVQSIIERLEYLESKFHSEKSLTI
ncbi:4371_t:CDS:1 [Cetraspora pellucida]|uniref:4371_t:CDS:1 n=1 Tax=Cetraspora pellucida TaxID=1433469 RepID=A0A9N9CU72_9GLOM|nr:4371_t:CDS:1 [Cetraspora pellucida]